MSKRFALVFPLRLQAQHLGKELFLLPEGLRRLGHEVEIHCASAEPGVAWPVPVVAAGADLERPEHYAGRGLSGALVYTFLRFPRLLAAIRTAGLRLVAKGDTAGTSVVRAHPRATLEYARYALPARRDRARMVLEWVARLGPFAARDLRILVDSLTVPDVTVVETPSARAAVERSLRRGGHDRLADRLRVVANPVSEVFCATPVRAARDPLVVAVGRWDDPAKDARLLARVLARLRSARPDHRVVVVGPGGDAVPGAGIERPGVLDQAAIAALFNQARIVISSSRWEGSSLSSHEALAMGCSVVGPAMTPFTDIAAAGPFGTVAARDADALAGALESEARAWEGGEARDPRRTAAFWRERLSVDRAGREYARLLGADA